MTPKILCQCGGLGIAALLATGCTPERGTAGIDGTGAPTPFAAYSYGRVADFGSIWVNGIRYDTSTAQFLINGTPGSQADLDIDDIVLVEGRLSGSGGIADRVVFDHVLVGPIESVDATSESLVALGQAVRISSETSFDSTIQGGIAGLGAGVSINVSGFRTADGAIAATRLGTQPPGVGELRTTGAVTSVASAAKRFNLNALVVDYGSALVQGVSGGAIARGDVVTVRGASLGADGALIAASVDVKRTSIQGNAGDRVDIEGYVTAFDTGNPLNFEVAGLAVTTTSATNFSGSLTLDSAIEVEGSLSATGAVIANEVRTGFVPTLGTYAVEARVFDPYSGPIVGAPVNLWVQTGTSGYSYWWAHHPLYTDDAGRFSAPHLPDSQVTIHAFKPSFVQPCAVILDVHENVSVDIEMMSESTLTSLDPPRPQAARDPTLTGTIFEMTDSGRQPIAGAGLWAAHELEIDYADTKSDLQGRYFFCNVPPRTSELWAYKSGFTTVTIWGIDTSQSTVLDIELKRE
jgi:hypothetical protein